MVRRRGQSLLELLSVIVVIGVLAAMAFPALQWTRERARTINCLSSSRQQSLAALSFETRTGRLPGVDSRPLFVELSRDFGQPSICEQFDPLTPLNQNPNAMLGATEIQILRCKSARRTGVTRQLSSSTDYTLSSHVEGVRLSQITDGTVFTVMFFEFADVELRWIEAAPVPPSLADVRRSRHTTCHVATCGGSILTISKAIEAEVFQAMLTPNGGEVVKY